MSEQLTAPLGPCVIAFDLSLTGTGICYRDGSTSTVKTRDKDGDRRLLQIAEAARVAVDGADSDPVPDLAVIEDLPTHAKGAGITGMVHGIVRSILMEACVPYALVTPATLKVYATGKGNGDKVLMAVAAYKRAEREFPDDNQCDAWWLWCAGLDHLGVPAVNVPKAQRDALAKVVWPG